jgi:RimJ/RimL family protein N-acetyltransferase
MKWEIDKIVSSTLVVNRASQRVMEKCGLQFEPTFTYEKSLLPGWSEQERKAVKYGLSKSDVNRIERLNRS